MLLAPINAVVNERNALELEDVMARCQRLGRRVHLQPDALARAAWTHCGAYRAALKERIPEQELGQEATK